MKRLLSKKKAIEIKRDIKGYSCSTNCRSSAGYYGCGAIGW